MAVSNSATVIGRQQPVKTIMPMPFLGASDWPTVGNRTLGLVELWPDNPEGYTNLCCGHIWNTISSSGYLSSGRIVYISKGIFVELEKLLESATKMIQGMKDRFVL